VTEIHRLHHRPEIRHQPRADVEVVYRLPQNAVVMRKSNRELIILAPEAATIVIARDDPAQLVMNETRCAGLVIQNV
jgi:hypothetical protein